MTPKQAERLRQKITDIRRVLAAEKRKFGCYDDSRGLRYFPTRYYVQLGDFKSGLTYLRWFHRNFPDDAGFPDFLFEWTIILFSNGRLQDAAQKARATYRADTHLLASFLGRPITPAEPWEEAPLDAASYAAYFNSLGGQAALVDFGEWLAALTLTETFLADASHFIDLNRQLHEETDPERRRSLVQQLYPVSSGNSDE
ncbi:hypothetical protein [Hymenobacter sp. BRD67]|uniref:hypothetical protein n=1 Tax=Hymenobacter sp. BRD67 TaxID=2675877 RepID=UPI00156401C3|nr:hypothetical protein [Hymenobacter sp. BRD67]QKG55086.1 hypothetical protein GKZ67_21945 [Hymenobacter sp. BRD67]